jgi:hypothetical protein
MGKEINSICMSISTVNNKKEQIVPKSCTRRQYYGHLAKWDNHRIDSDEVWTFLSTASLENVTNFSSNLISAAQKFAGILIS